MNLSGGETLLKKDIFDFVELIAQEGIRFSLVTNGFLLNESNARRLADSGLNVLAISLDSVDEKIHDYIRGRQGACQKVMDAVKYFNRYRGKLQNITIQTVIMQPNLDKLIDLVIWAHDNQLSLSFMAITRPNMVPVEIQWYKEEEFSSLWPNDIQKVNGVIDRIIELKNSGYMIDNPVGQLERFKLYFSDPEKFARETPCGLGDGIMHINPRGDIYICCEMESIGNIKNGNIAGFWNSLKAKNVREQIRLCKKNCAGMVNCYREKDNK